ncbi:DUF2073 domain-containing protein [Halospeciosus flavus]|uniref:DUF2073 domain-containing protein n=1 Tax=Halospeciosus flavus TaxID=3032283 RepID=A0ABD5Z755_9EURY|nr:DUF2073 domain-containing protein [Halospeciosus flavus]
MPEVGHENEAEDGVQIDFISGEKMDGRTSMEKIRMILDTVREGDIVVLEKGLTPDEESKLIEVTMTEINPDGFTGIEIESFPRSETNDSSFLGRLMGKEETSKLTVIGPANQIQSLHKDETLISTLVSRR